jgi:hypothetical protein
MKERTLLYTTTYRTCCRDQVLLRLVLATRIRLAVFPGHNRIAPCTKLTKGMFQSEALDDDL